ncbi:hypothetical protein F183_A25540 [Bryobacterales bacterium F-183]|nr:hypothetical protein F183_A25540 [Bryobacterales bacterium F-183]
MQSRQEFANEESNRKDPKDPSQQTVPLPVDEGEPNEGPEDKIHKKDRTRTVFANSNASNKAAGGVS